ncbi:outer membrane beta-barrel protein [candidate division KSB1 bacterium]|nr:outer membrane beta-barrel protein [candidate division KSB1 bacterium]
MKTKYRLVVAVLGLVSLTAFSGQASAQLKSTSIGCRGSFWHMNDQTNSVHVSSRWGDESSVHTGGGGGWLILASRLSDMSWLEVQVGAVGQMDKLETTNYTREEFEGYVITPLLFGVRYEFMSPRNRTALIPYVGFGAGPYWISKVQGHNDIMEDEVNIDTNLKPGGYLGGGMNFRLASWCAFNFDMKYHFIDFDKNYDRSGFDYGIGMNFYWGQFE